MFPLKPSISFRGFPARGRDFILSATRRRSRAMDATFSFGRKAKACRWRRVWLKNARIQIPTQLVWFMEKMMMIWKWIVPSKIDGFNHQKWWISMWSSKLKFVPTNEKAAKMVIEKNPSTTGTAQRNIGSEECVLFARCIATLKKNRKVTDHYFWLVVDLPLWKTLKSVGVTVPKIWTAINQISKDTLGLSISKK